MSLYKLTSCDILFSQGHLTMAQYAHLSTPDPEWAEISAHLTPAKPVESIQTYREEVIKYGRMTAQANTETACTLSRLLQLFSFSPTFLSTQPQRH